MHCIELHCIALYCIVFHCIALYCIVLHYIALSCIAMHCPEVSLLWVAWKLLKRLRVLLYCIALHFLHCIALHFLALYCIVLHCIVLKFHCSRFPRSCLKVPVWWVVVVVLNQVPCYPNQLQ